MRAEDIPFDDVLHALFDHQEMLHDQLIRDMCLLRALNTLLTGGLFTASGVMMQGISHNPIAEPSILGITQGSVMFVAIALVLSLFTVAGNFWTALAGAGFSGLLVFLFVIKYAGHPDILCVFLADSILNILSLSVVPLSALIQDRSRKLAFWIAGGFRQTGWGAVIGLEIVTLVCTGSFLLPSGKINLLSPGDEVTISLDIDAAGLKKKVVLVMIPFCAAYVAVVGNIGFVGLFVPHILRSMFSWDIRHTLPLSFLFGGVLMVFPDIAARTLSTPYELPIGLFIALLGVPVFLLLVRKEYG